VKDATAAEYSRALAQFLRWASEQGCTARTVSDLDYLLAEYFSVLCFDQRVDGSRAAFTFSAVKHFLPEIGKGLPAAARALKAYKKIFVGREGEGFGEEVWGILLARLYARDQEAALILALSVDAYLRGAEWAALRPEDVHFAATSAALSLGVVERGEETKTGSNQGVVVDRPWVARWLRDFARRRKKGEFFFSISRDDYHALFDDAARDLRAAGLPLTPHSARHAGATIDALVNGKSMPDIQRRGRWLAPASVARYAKPHVLVRQNARLSKQMLQKGREFLDKIKYRQDR